MNILNNNLFLYLYRFFVKIVKNKLNDIFFPFPISIDKERRVDAVTAFSFFPLSQEGGH